MGAGITSGGGHVTRIGSCSSGGLKLIKRRRRRSRATSGRPPQFLTLKSFQTNSIYPLIAGCIRPELPSISINFHQFFPLSPGLRPELRHHCRAVDPIQDRIPFRIGSHSGSDPDQDRIPFHRAGSVPWIISWIRMENADEMGTGRQKNGKYRWDLIDGAGWPVGGGRGVAKGGGRR